MVQFHIASVFYVGGRDSCVYFMRVVRIHDSMRPSNLFLKGLECVLGRCWMEEGDRGAKTQDLENFLPCSQERRYLRAQTIEKVMGARSARTLFFQGLGNPFWAPFAGHAPMM